MLYLEEEQIIPHLSANLQKFKLAMANPMPVPLDQLTEAMLSLSKFATNAKYLAAMKNQKQPAKQQAKQPKKYQAAKPTSAKHKEPKLSESESEDNESQTEDSEETEDETNITLNDIKVNDSIVWGASAGKGKVLLCVGLVTKKKTRGASAVVVTYLLPVSQPTGRWLGEKLHCGKYRKQELSSEEIKTQVFFKIEWEEADYSNWDFKLGEKSWSEIVRLVQKVFLVKPSGITFSST